MTRIAFIGVGNMGRGMAANQVKAGHEIWALSTSMVEQSMSRAPAAALGRMSWT